MEIRQLCVVCNDDALYLLNLVMQGRTRSSSRISDGLRLEL